MDSADPLFLTAAPADNLGRSPRVPSPRCVHQVRYSRRKAATRRRWRRTAVISLVAFVAFVAVALHVAARIG